MDASVAVEFNNLGVVLLADGCLREALDLFKGASQFLTLLVNRERGSSKSIQISHDIFYRDPRIQRACEMYNEFCDEFDMETMSTESSFPLDPSHESGLASQLFICKRAIRISEQQLPRSGAQPLLVCCSIVLYNMALIYHLAATSETVLESTGQKALHLYEMSFALLSDEKFPSDSILVARLMMYCLNNMASLNHDLTRWDVAAECMKRLTTIATLMQSNGIDPYMYAECQSFLLNAMVLKEPVRAPAA
jgi:hypothetical protein